MLNIPKNRYSFSCNPHLENNVPWSLTKEEWLVKFREAMILKNVNSISLVNQIGVSQLVADSIVSHLENLRNKRRANSLKIRKEKSKEAKLQFKALYKNGYTIKEISAKLGYSIKWCFNTKKELSLITINKEKRNKINSLQKNNLNLICNPKSYYTKCTISNRVSYKSLFDSFNGMESYKLVDLTLNSQLICYNEAELEAMYNALMTKNEKLYADKIWNYLMFGTKTPDTDEQLEHLSITDEYLQ